MAFEDFLSQQRQRVQGHTTSIYRRYLRRRRALAEEHEDHVDVESRGLPQPSERGTKEWV